MTIITAVKGMKDRFGGELDLWNWIEQKTKLWFHAYRYQEVRTPLLEELSLFVRGVGETSDIVEKEMYILNDRDGQPLALRPENTAGVVRALVEHGKLLPDASFKTFYIGPMFRRERPQKGRLRQFHQIGAELFGVAGPQAEIELLTLLHDWFTDLGLLNLKLLIHTLGDPSEREGWRAVLETYFQQHQDSLCTDCKRRLQTNPLRILDCKQSTCQHLAKNAPPIISFLRKDSLQHFEQVQKGLLKSNIPFEIAPHMVRGLDYYTRTVFELVAMDGLGAQNTVAAGGRYDGLVAQLGGPSTPAVGFACGLERMVLLLESLSIAVSDKPDLMLVYADIQGREYAHSLARSLREKGLKVELDLQERSVKSQMRKADKIQTKTVIVMGEQEVKQQTALLKWMNATKEPQVVSLNVKDIIQIVHHSEK